MLYDAGRSREMTTFVKFFHEHNYGKIKRKSIQPFHSSSRQFFIDKGLSSIHTRMFRSALDEAEDVYARQSNGSASSVGSPIHHNRRLAEMPCAQSTPTCRQPQLSSVTGTIQTVRKDLSKQYMQHALQDSPGSQNEELLVLSHAANEPLKLTGKLRKKMSSAAKVSDKNMKRKGRTTNTTAKKLKKDNVKVSATTQKSKHNSKEVSKLKTKKNNFEKSRKFPPVGKEFSQSRSSKNMKRKIDINLRDKTRTKKNRSNSEEMKILTNLNHVNSLQTEDNSDIENVQIGKETHQLTNVRKNKILKIQKNDGNKCRKREKCKSKDNFQNGFTPNVNRLLNELPVPMSLNSADDFSLYLPTPPLPGLSPKEPFDPNLDKSEASSDEEMDLPVGLSPVCGGTPVSEKEIVWLKWRNHPYWPAYVNKVYTKKSRLKMSYMFLAWDDQERRHKGICQWYKQGKVYPFNCERKEEFINAGRLIENVAERSAFQEANRIACEFLNNRALGTVNSHDFIFLSHRDEDIEDSDDMSPSPSSLSFLPLESAHDRISPESVTSSRFGRRIENKKLSKQTEERLQKNRRKYEALVRFILSDQTKQHLCEIFCSKIKSHRHTKFREGTTKDRMKLKHSGFGPIADESQQEDIVKCLLEWLTECYKSVDSKRLTDVAYLLDVWVPEAVVFGLTHVKTYSKAQAWRIFEKGVKMTKNEKQLIHNDLIAGIHIMSDSERDDYYAQLQERVELSGLS
ncbi:hypothetical protein ScPMuIL_018660 [Solemya velum]